MKMQTNKNGFLRNFCVAALVSLLAQCVWAATQVAVWEAGNASATGATIAFNTKTSEEDTKGNTLNADGSVTIVKRPIQMTLTNAFSVNGGYSVLVKYSGFSKATANQVLSVARIGNEGDLIGLYTLNTDGTLAGIWNNGAWTTTTGGSGEFPESGIFAQAADSTAHNQTKCYAIGTDASSATEYYNGDGLWGSNRNLFGFCIGGMTAHATSDPTSGGLVPATGLTVSGIAIFSGKLTTDEMVSYRWPSEIITYTGTVAGGSVTWDKTLPEAPTPNDHLVLEGSGDAPVPAKYASYGQISIGEGVNLTGVDAADIASGKFTGDGAIVVTSDCTLTVPVGVKVKTRGDIAVTLTNDGTFEVENGTCSVNAPANQAIKGTVIVREGATFKNVRSSDALAYRSTVNVHVYGTLAFESTRWTFGANNKLYLYTGANVTGSGEGNNGALDFNDASTTIYVKPNGEQGGKVFCSATIRTAYATTVEVAPGMEFEVSSVFKSNNDNVTKTGAGLMTVKSAMATGVTVNGGTLKFVSISPARVITLGQNGTLELSQNEAKDAFTFTGTVASAALGNGTIKTAGSTVTLSGTFTNYSGDIDSSAADSKFIIPVDQEVTVGLIAGGSKIEIEGMLVHTNKVTNNSTSYQGKDLSGLTGNGTFKITGPHYFFTCGTDSIAKYWAPTLALWNDRGDSTIANNKGIVFGQPVDGNATITLGSLSGAGLIRTDANNGERTIKIVQAKNTEWSGAFNAGDRVKAVIVTGVDGATEKTLTLSGTQTHNNDLTIEAAGSVKLTGTWVATTTTVNGRLEVLDSATLTTTTLTSAGSLKTADSTVYFGSDALASAEAAAKAGTTYYATIADAIAAATLADITVINASAEVPAGYAKVTTDGVVTLRRVGGKVYYKDGAWSDGCIVWADAEHTSTTTFNVADTMVLDANNTVVYPNAGFTSALKIEIAAGITAVIGHDNYLSANPYNVPDNSVIALGEGAHLGVTFWNNSTDYTPAFGTVTINGGTFGVYNVTSKAINAGTIKGTSQLVLNDGETITVSGSIETTPISGVDTKKVATKTVEGKTVYGLVDKNPEPVVPEEGTGTFPEGTVITKPDGTTVSGSTLPEVTGTYTVQAMKDGFPVGDPESFGVIVTTDAAVSEKRPVVVAVPFAGATVGNIVKTTNLTAGDELMALEGANYRYWTLTSAKKWVPKTTVLAEGLDEGTEADAVSLARGTAIWVVTADKVVTQGKSATTPTPELPTTATTTYLLANPTMDAYTVPVAQAAKDDQVVLPGSSTRYTVIETAGGEKSWKCKKSVPVVIPGLGVSGSEEQVSDEVPSIGVGKGFWFLKK